jgi:anti-sigma factor RsiW
MSEPLDERTREELTAYLDGEMDEPAAAALEKRLRSDPQLQRELESLKRAWDLLDFLPQPEPSPEFTARTLNRLEIVRSPQPATVTMPPLGSLPGATPPRASLWRWVLTAGVAGVAGYFLMGLALPPTPRPPTPAELEERLAADLRLLDRLHLYRYAESVEFLRALDHPDLFGDSP